MEEYEFKLRNHFLTARKHIIYSLAHTKSIFKTQHNFENVLILENGFLLKCNLAPVVS